MKVKTIPETLRINRFNYDLYKREGDVAILRQELVEGELFAFEVHIVRKKALLPPKEGYSGKFTEHLKKLFDAGYSHMEFLAGNEEFGRYAWTYREIERAESKFNELVEAQEKNKRMVA